LYARYRGRRLSRILRGTERKGSYARWRGRRLSRLRRGAEGKGLYARWRGRRLSRIQRGAEGKGLYARWRGRLIRAGAYPRYRGKGAGPSFDKIGASLGPRRGALRASSPAESLDPYFIGVPRFTFKSRVGIRVRRPPAVGPGRGARDRHGDHSSLISISVYTVCSIFSCSLMMR
jgi:hypothetical protein